jgi:DNA-binding MarR family transcriptional regulator
VATTAELTDREYRALADFRHALRVFQHFSEDAARAEGLAPNQHQLLLAVRGFDGEGAPTISDVAERLQLQHHSTVELVGRAVRAGLLRRAPDAADKRRQRLSLTAKGERRLSALAVVHRDELRRFRDEMADVLRELG